MIAGAQCRRTRIFLVDDHQLLAQSMAAALVLEGFEATVAEMDDRDRVVEQVVEQRPDLVLLDLDIGGEIGDGALLVAPFRAAGARVLVVSGSSDRHWRGRAIEEGALAVLDKSTPFDRLLDSIVAVARGEDVMSPAARLDVIAEVRRTRERQRALLEPFGRLTTSEHRVLAGLSDGDSVAEMARSWVVSEATVRTQVRGVLTKLGVKSQLEAVALARRAGWTATREGVPTLV